MKSWYEVISEAMNNVSIPEPENYTEAILKVIEVTGYTKEKIEEIVNDKEAIVMLSKCITKESNFLSDITEEHEFPTYFMDMFCLIKKNYPTEVKMVLDKWFLKSNNEWDNDEVNAYFTLRKCSITDIANSEKTYMQILEDKVGNKLNDNSRQVLSKLPQSAKRSALSIAVLGGDINHILSGAEWDILVVVEYLLRIFETGLWYNIEFESVTVKELFNFYRTTITSMDDPYWGRIQQLLEAKALISDSDYVEVIKPGTAKKITLDSLK